jgi:hypothetical protein
MRATELIKELKKFEEQEVNVYCFEDRYFITTDKSFIDFKRKVEERLK